MGFYGVHKIFQNKFKESAQRFQRKWNENDY